MTGVQDSNLGPTQVLFLRTPELTLGAFQPQEISPGTRELTVVLHVMMQPNFAYHVVIFAERFFFVVVLILPSIGLAMLCNYFSFSSYATGLVCFIVQGLQVLVGNADNNKPLLPFNCCLVKQKFLPGCLELLLRKEHRVK